MKSCGRLFFLLSLLLNLLPCYGNPTIIIKGKIDLPVAHLKNLIPKFLQRDFKLDQEQFRSGHHENLDHYPLFQPLHFPYSAFFEVRAVPIPGPHRETKDFSNPDLAKAPFFEGKVHDDGSYEIVAPAHPGEYVIVLQTDQMIWKRVIASSSMDGVVISGQDLDLEQTVIAEIDLALESFQIFLPVENIPSYFLNTIKEKVFELEYALKKEKVRSRQWRRIGLEALDEALQVRLKRKKFDDRKLLTKKSLGPRYDFSFLGSAQRMEQLEVEVWKQLKRFKFASEVLLSPHEMNQAKATVPEVFAGNDSSDVKMQNAHITTTGLGPMKVWLRWKQGVRSLGFKLEKQTALIGPSAFEVRLYSSVGEVIETYRWWTLPQDQGAGFYGISSPQKFAVAEITMPSAGKMILSDVLVSDFYDPKTQNGWRPLGAWSMIHDKPPTKSVRALQVTKSIVPWVFDHQAREVSSPLKIEDRCTYEYNSSSGSYYHMDMGQVSASESSDHILVSPVVHLSNLPLDEQDLMASERGDFASWISGTWKGLDELDILAGQSPCLDYTQTVNKNYLLRNRGGAGFNRASYADVPRAAHWAQLDFQGRFDGPPSQGKKIIEYSLDNGNSWQQAWWYRDEKHRGQQGRWFNNQLALYSDSDLVNHALETPCLGTDFNQDGKSDFHFDIGGDGQINDKDCRQWDQRFYHFPKGTLSTSLPENREQLLSLIPGASVLVRFRWERPKKAQVCSPGQCPTWDIDDVSINSDVEDLGYFTDFDWANQPWQ